MIDEQDAVEMVHLMLDAGGEQAGCITLDRFSREAAVPDTDRFGADNLGILGRQRKAAFLASRHLL